jgi:hypothetical protein
VLSPEVLYFAGVVAAVVVVTFVATPSGILIEPTTINDAGVVCKTSDAGELVPADPLELAAGAGMDPSAYALARVLESEASNLPWIAQIGIGWTVVNHARSKGRSVLSVVTRATLQRGAVDGAGDGFFGRQGNRVGGYRYVASSKDSTADSRATATAILAGEIDDPTGGALNFDSPQSYGVQEGTDVSGADEFAANRESEGKRLLVLPGTNENRIRFWVPA